MKVKYTLIPLLYSSFSLCLAGIDYHTTNSTLTNPVERHYSGFYTALSEQRLWDSTLNNQNVTLPSTVTLNSISIVASCLAPTITQDTRIAIYEYSNNTLGSYMGLSNDFIHFQKGQTQYTVKFSNITLDPAKTYGYFFVRNDESTLNLDTTDPTLRELYLNIAITVLGDSVMATKDSKMSTLPSNSGTFTDRTLTKGKDAYMPLVLFSTSNNVIPEPTSVSLGILGLGFYLLRRKRA